MSYRKKIHWDVRKAVIERDGPFCRYCGAGPYEFGWRRDGKGRLRPWVGYPLHLDHVIPYSRGGSSEPDNLLVACETCNRKKWVNEAPAALPSRPVEFPEKTFANVVMDHFQAGGMGSRY